jgi:hypothetical protein
MIVVFFFFSFLILLQMGAICSSLRLCLVQRESRNYWFLSVERRLGPRTFGTGMQVMIQFLQIAAASSNGEDPVAFGLRFLAQAEE